MRLIDADELRKSIEDLPNCYNGFSDTYDKACIIGVLEELPTVEPVKRGRWYRPEGWPKKTYKRKCTHCQGVAYFCGNGDYLYCPNCGAKMDLEGEKE